MTDPVKTWLDMMPPIDPVGTEPDALEVQDVLSNKIYGMWEAKERVLEYIASGNLNVGVSTPPFLIVGANGIGKTTFIKELATCLKRPYIQIPFSLLLKTSDVRGDTLKSVGRGPGQLIKALIRAKAMNPIIHIRDINLVPKAVITALYEVVDPEQNKAFMDRFLGVPVDMSKATFFFTACNWNFPSFPVDEEEIEAESFLDDEKLEIYDRFLIPRLREETGVGDLKIPRPSLKYIMVNYAREAGVSDLYRVLKGLSHKICLMQVRGKKVPPRLSVKDIKKILGHEPHWQAPPSRQLVGCANGLGWTGEGGSIIPIEAVLVPGGGDILLTGGAGPVMNESATVAWDYIKTISKSLGIKLDLFNKISAHINLPDISSHKEGPSASAAMTVALASLLINRSVAGAIAMTGEMTLKGKIIPVGGIQEKITAAVRAKMKIVILPKDNRGDIEELRKPVADKIQIVLADRIEDYLDICLGPKRVRDRIIKKNTFRSSTGQDT